MTASGRITLAFALLAAISRAVAQVSDGGGVPGPTTEPRVVPGVVITKFDPEATQSEVAMAWDLLTRVSVDAPDAGPELLANGEFGDMYVCQVPVGMEQLTHSALGSV
jgi:hypothetical protein